MTESGLQDLLLLAINQSTMAEGTRIFNIDNAKSVAEKIGKLAIAKVGRFQATEFNKKRVTFALTANKASYDIGPDILKKFPNIWNLEFMYVTTSPGIHIDIVGLDIFRDSSAGSTTTGMPRIASLNSSDRILEFWPEPDKAYDMIGQVKINVSKLAAIPIEYHDAVLTAGYQLIHAARNVSMANAMSREARDDLERDQQPAWAGSRIIPTRSLGSSYSRRGSDSLNITGD